MVHEEEGPGLWAGSNACTVQQRAADEWHDEEARPLMGLPHATVEAGVVATAAFLISGRWL